MLTDTPNPAEQLTRVRQPEFRFSPVEENRVDILVRDRRFLGAGGHFERTQKDGDERRQLLDVFFLAGDHPEHDAETTVAIMSAI